MFKDSDSLEQMDNGITDTISKLKFIGHIQKGEKINVRHLYVQPDTLINRITRTFFALDNRINTYNFIEGIVNRSFDIITITLSRGSLRGIDKRLISGIVADLKLSISGISNLRETYSNDVMFCCKLDALIESISSRLEDAKETLEAISIITDSDESVD